jgi:phosphoribosylpyrophosphate synthetase
MRERISNYKDGTDSDRLRFAPEVAGILARFFAECGGPLTERTGGWDVASVVPSAGGREPPHPLEVVLDAEAHGSVPNREVLLTHVGEVGHRAPNEGAFRVSSDVDSGRVLLLDDVYTTGAEAQSAASALDAAGAQVIAIVVIARRINPDYSEAHGRMWDRQTKIPFRFTDPPWWAEKSR